MDAGGAGGGAGGEIGPRHSLMDSDGHDGNELEWQFLQCFGERTPGEEIQDADIITTVSGVVVFYTRQGDQCTRKGLRLHFLGLSCTCAGLIVHLWTCFTPFQVCFDSDGDHLATGDRGGRVVLFER